VIIAEYRNYALTFILSYRLCLFWWLCWCLR